MEFRRAGALGYSPSIYEITVSDIDRTGAFSSDVSLPGHQIYERSDIDRAGSRWISLAIGGSLRSAASLRIAGCRSTWGQRPFGNVRVAISTALLRNEISPGLENAGLFALSRPFCSTLMAFVLSRATLAPVQKISAQLDRITAGESDVEPVAANGRVRAGELENQPDWP